MVSVLQRHDPDSVFGVVTTQGGMVFDDFELTGCAPKVARMIRKHGSMMTGFSFLN